MRNVKNPAYFTTDFLALLLDHIETVYEDNTEDWTTIHAVRIAIEAIRAGGKPISTERIEVMIGEIAALASWVLSGEAELTLEIHKQLVQIRNACPEFAEPVAAE